jgi:hypothetical protein
LPRRARSPCLHLISDIPSTQQEKNLKKTIVLIVVALGMCSQLQAATCTPTGFMRDGINMTAALINPPGVLTALVDATGCNVGVYYEGGHDARLNGADVFGANYFGVLVNTDNGGTSRVSIKNSIVHHVGEVPHNGTQHGVAIYLRGFAGTIKGVIDNDQVFDYQKGGITANGPEINVDITNNTVTGDGHVTFTAQNGIQMAFGASHNTIAGNYVYGNSYIGIPGDGSASAGILVFGGPTGGGCPPAGADCEYDVALQIRGNNLVANDVGVYLFNADASDNPSPAPTNIRVTDNVIYGDICYNQSYQAGISDVGNADRMINNLIYGAGYTACATGTTIDVSDATDPTVRNRPRHLPRPHRDSDWDDRN